MTHRDEPATHRHMTRGGYTLGLIVFLGGALLVAAAIASLLH